MSHIMHGAYNNGNSSLKYFNIRDTCKIMHGSDGTILADKKNEMWNTKDRYAPYTYCKSPQHNPLLKLLNLKTSISF